MLSYVQNYGHLDFTEKPFNEVDAAVFSQLIYNDFKEVVEKGNILTLAEAAEKFYRIHTNEELENLLDIAQRASRLLTVCAQSKRYQSVIVSDFIDNVNDSIDKQISAANFLLSDDTLVVSFRGTDATVAGFKESAMLAYMFPIPAQIEALHYFQETAMIHDGELIICGHSKGGNLAQYAAVNCANSLQRQIKSVYSFDAPGFPQWFFERYDYRQIAERLNVFTPQGSLVGRALHMERVPNIIVSEAKQSKQHNVFTWLIEGDRFVRTDKFNEESDKLSAYLNDLVAYIGEEDLDVFYDALEQTANEMGVTSFYDLKKVDVSLLTIFIDSIQTLNPQQKERFMALARKVMADAAKGYVFDKAHKAKKYVISITNKIPVGKKKEDENKTDEN